MLYQTVIIELRCLTQKRANLTDKNIQPPKDGVEEFLAKLSERYTVKIYYKGNLDKLTVWIVKHNLLKYISDITRKKEKCDLFITAEKIRMLKEIAHLQSHEFFFGLE